MARSQIAVTLVSRVGVAQGAQTTADSTNKHYFDNMNFCMLEIISTDAGTQTVSIVFAPAVTVDGVAPPSKLISVPAGATRYAGPFPPAYYNQAGGQIFVDPSVSTTLKFRVYQVPSS